MPWIIDDIEDKIQTSLGIGHLNSIEIESLDCKLWIANELIDLLCCYELPEDGLSKLTLCNFKSQCVNIEDEVVSRLANICPRLTHLELINMVDLSEEGLMLMVSILRQIILKNPPILVLNMEKFNSKMDYTHEICKLVLESLLSSNINTITDLNFSKNQFWFWNLEKTLGGSEDFKLLLELILK